MDKHDFMRACREGGAAIERALRSIDQAFFEPLYAYGMRSIKDPDRTLDLVQETFIKVWRRCATFQGDSELLPWMKSILRHCMLDELRRPRRAAAFDEDDMSAEVGAWALQLSRDVPTPADEARRAQLAACFERCWVRFEAAAPAHSAVIAWIVEDGLSNEEIAALLERSPGATREFISQCRKRARVHLAEWYELALGKDEAT